MFSIKGRIALVTGGAVGIGQAIAIGLAQAGADVAIVSPTADARQTQQAVEAVGQRFHAVCADLMKPESAARVVAEVEAHPGARGYLGQQRRHHPAGVGRALWRRRLARRNRT
ncbi:MAG: SDR family NAD(P)-dependent oxidoreductase [Meiothermus sp.]|uniref:SDR family NAD(P)-dependent oxidoreductase n=1 Tax=Meiothermus sp. TaxID=1955249 RepID=UPI00298EFF62|nr:SDR family NAD(P)-dependent oxidoreductase [Meiothermus sp.]MDW8481586.1 SDR family NAD(P)-dependent oxidoreductase [Meiothermus sp.]